MPENRPETGDFVRRISRMPAIHRSFRNDPVGTLNVVAPGLGIDPKKVDPVSIELLASLTEEEARLIESLSDKAERFPDLAAGHDGAIIF